VFVVEMMDLGFMMMVLFFDDGLVDDVRVGVL